MKLYMSLTWRCSLFNGKEILVNIANAVCRVYSKRTVSYQSLPQLRFKQGKEECVANEMELLMLRDIRRVVTLSYFQVGRDVGSRAFQDVKSIDGFVKTGIHDGIEIFPESPAVISRDAPPPCGFPLSPLLCLHFYATVYWNLAQDVQRGKCRPERHFEVNESFRRFRHCVILEYGLFITISTLAEMECNAH